VAALATFLNIPYEEMFTAAVAQSKAFRRGDGLTINELLAMAKAFRRPLVRLHHRRVNLEEHSGILGVNWHREEWSARGGSGHWVVLRTGTIIDPSGPTFSDASDYLAVNRGRAGTLLHEPS
jgi:hypothetical protein